MSLQMEKFVYGKIAKMCGQSRNKNQLLTWNFPHNDEMCGQSLNDVIVVRTKLARHLLEDFQFKICSSRNLSLNGIYCLFTTVYPYVFMP